MEKLRMEIGGLPLSIGFADPDSRAEDCYRPFLSSRGGPPAGSWRVSREAIPETWQRPAPEAPPFPRWDIVDSGGEIIFRLRKAVDSPELWKAARTDPDLSRVEIRTDLSPESVIHPLRELVGLLFAHFLLPRRGLIVHAAAAEYGGAGYLFPAPGGGGKSTWAELLRSQSGWTVLGEDKVILRAAGGGCRIFSCPWNPIRERQTNDSAPLAGIYFLRHRAAEEIRPLGVGETVRKLLGQTFLPFPGADDLEKAISLLEEAAGGTPAFAFGFRPKDSAAGYFRDFLSGKPDR